MHRFGWHDRHILRIRIDTSESKMDEMPFNVGDRVILQGLVRAQRLNGRHGVVGLPIDPSTGRFPIDLALPDALTSGSNSSGIAVKRRI